MFLNFLNQMIRLSPRQIKEFNPVAGATSEDICALVYFSCFC